MTDKFSPRSILLTGCGHHALCLLVALSLLAGVCSPNLPSTSAGAPEEELASLLRGAALRLGWTGTPTRAGDLPGQPLQIASGQGARAAVTRLPEGGGPAFLQAYGRRGLTRGVFHGWEAIIVRSTDLWPSDDPRVGVPAAGHGLVAWRSGPLSFLAEDASGAGRELEIAEALHAEAVEQGLLPLSSTVVILAEAGDTPGQQPRAHYEALAAEANRYYAANGYGRVAFDLSFLEGKGSRGSGWTRVGPTASAYPTDGYELGVAALQQALRGSSLPEAVALERVIVVCAAGSPGASAPWCARASTLWLSEEHTIAVQGAERLTRVTVHNLVLLSEEEQLGTWVHELGHTLPAWYDGCGELGRLDDRYDGGRQTQRTGRVGYWDLMGGGSRWGWPQSTAPTHMSSYTKVAAGWLRTQEAGAGREYTLTALEALPMGAAVLKLADPASADPLSYYLIEARDNAAPFGAPEAGVMIYRVSADPDSGRDIVEALNCQSEDTVALAGGTIYPRSTLHGTLEPNGARTYVIAGRLAIRLVAESFVPYRATLRIERLAGQ